MPKKSWIEKFESCKQHQVKTLDKNIAGMKAGQVMLIPSAQIVDLMINAIPKGKGMDVIELREKLAKKYKAEVTCPISTGFIMRMVAEAAFEKLNAGGSLKSMTPIWRVLDKDSKTLPKLSFDTDFIFQQRQLEKLD